MYLLTFLTAVNTQVRVSRWERVIEIQLISHLKRKRHPLCQPWGKLKSALCSGLLKTKRGMKKKD